jgi:hypothetical protein
MSSRFAALAVDCLEPRPLAEFWCAVLDYVITEEGADGVTIAPSEAGTSSSPSIDFLPVPEIKAVKNRLHIDVRPAADISQEEEVERLIELGAKRVDVGQPSNAPWVVLADLEGNEFCVLRTPAVV